jgi:hypothetical protein
VTGQPAVPPVSASDVPSRPSRRLLDFAAIVAVVWSAILIGMAWLTANPVTLNRDQILRADLVITGKVEYEPAEGQVSVSHEWKKNRLTGTIHVENLDQARVQQGKTYLMPLTREGSEAYYITGARLANSAPLVYPATREAIEQLEKILADRPDKK